MSTSAAAADLMKSLISSRTGIIRQVTVGKGVAQANLFLAEAVATNPIDGHNLNGGGCAPSRDHAVLTAIMEAVERYSASIEPTGSFCEPAGGRPHFLTTRRFSPFSAHQYDSPSFPFRRLEEDTLARWQPVRCLFTDNIWYAPMAWTQVPFIARNTQENLYCSNSSGLAANQSLESAIISALFEQIERDALLFHWYGRISPPILPIRVQEIMAPDIARAQLASGCKVIFLNITTDIGVPTVACVARTEVAGQLLTTIGAATRFTALEASQKAFCEAMSERARCLALVQSGAARPQSPNEICTFEVRPLYYMESPQSEEISFLLSGQEDPTPITSLNLPVRTLEHLLDRIRPKIGPLFWADLTSSDVESVGIRVVKVIAPNLIQLYADHRFPYLGAPRLDTPRLSGALNEQPHPFA